MIYSIKPIIIHCFLLFFKFSLKFTLVCVIPIIKTAAECQNDDFYHHPVCRYIVQPNNVEMIQYGRLVMDGELKVKCDGETMQSARYTHNT